MDNGFDNLDIDTSADMDTSEVVDDTPYDILENMPEEVPENISEDAPEMMEEDDLFDDIPEDVPEGDPEVVEAGDLSADIPEDVPEDEQEVVEEDDLTDDIPEDVPEGGPEVVEAGDLPADIPEDVPEDEQEVVEEDDLTDDIPEDVPEGEPEVVEAGDLPADIPEDVPEDEQEVVEEDDLTDDIPEDIPEDLVEADDTTTNEIAEDTTLEVDNGDFTELTGDTQDEPLDGTVTEETIKETAHDVNNDNVNEKCGKHIPPDTQQTIGLCPKCGNLIDQCMCTGNDGSGIDADADNADYSKTLKRGDLDLLKSGNNAINQRLEAQADDYRDKGMSEDEIRDRLAADKRNFQKEFLEDAFPGQDVSPNVFNGFPKNGSKDRLADIEQSQNNYSDIAEGQNFNPKRDIANAFEFADRNYERDSAHWQEVANRHLDNLNQEVNEISSNIPVAKEQFDTIEREMSNYLGTSGLTQQEASIDSHFQELNRKYLQARNNYEGLMDGQNKCQNQINEIAPFINPDMKTTYRGMNGADFNDSYKDYITEPQGNAVPGYGGVCGIDETCSIVNQQTGSNLGEVDGIKEYVSNGWCETNNTYDRNGGTNAIGRSEFLDSKGLTFQRIEGSYNNRAGISLDYVAQRFNDGESAGLMLRAQDLSQPDIASRKFSFRNSILDNASRYNANHATTIAGFSYDNDGKVAGVWINDTGSCTGKGVNRVYIDAAKFNKMQSNTDGFAVEFSRKR